jgi:hypothetical protein
MALLPPIGLLDSLNAAKGKLVEFSSLAAETDNWAEAQTAIEWAKKLDAMVTALSGKDVIGSLGSETLRPVARQNSVDGQSFPRFYVEDNRLVKIGAKRDKEGTYEHRVTHANYDLVVQQLCKIAGFSNEFETQKLIDHCDIPKHEPGIVLAVLEKQGLLANVRRGKWEFLAAASFSAQVQDIWDRIPWRGSF